MKETRDRSDFVNLRIPRDLWKRLEPIAKEDRRSTASLAHLAISSWLGAIEATSGKVKKSARRG